MLSLILPPIGVVLCGVFLFWLFWKKRGVLRFYARKEMSSQTIAPPRVPREVSQSEEGTQKPGIGALVGKIVNASFAWVGSFVGRFLKKVFRKEVLPDSFREESLLVGVSTVVEEGGRMHDPVDKKGNADSRFEGTGSYGYLKGRPMISDEMVLPQKQQEKDRYEEVLIERIALNPKDIEAYERLGDYYMENGNLNDAKECFKQVLRLSPLSRRARIRMRRVEKSLSGR